MLRTLRYSLTHLPSPQHQAGLGGLLAVMESLDTPPPLLEVTSDRLCLTLDKDTLARLVGRLYEGTDTFRLLKGKPKTGEWTQEVVGGQVRYRVPAHRPAGAWLTKLGLPAPWLDFWQDEVWHSLRGVPKSKEVYHGSVAALVDKIWKALEKEADGRSASLPLTSSIAIGARDKNSEGVKMEGVPSEVLLLHFAHALAHPRKVALENVKGEQEGVGSVLVLPVPGDLRAYLSAIREVYGGLSSVEVVWRTRVSGAEEAALDFLARCPGASAAFVAEFRPQRYAAQCVAMVHASQPAPSAVALVAKLSNLALRGVVCRNLLRGDSGVRGVCALLAEQRGSYEIAKLQRDAGKLLWMGPAQLPIAQTLAKLTEHWLTSEADRDVPRRDNPKKVARHAERWSAHAGALLERLVCHPTGAALERLLAEVVLRTSRPPSAQSMEGLRELARCRWRELADLWAVTVLFHSQKV